jgi:hypothetical protein
MQPLTLEERLTALEKRIARIEEKLGLPPPEKAWLRTIGKFEDLKEVFDEAMKLREQDRARARRRFAKKKSAKRKPTKH